MKLPDSNDCAASGAESCTSINAAVTNSTHDAVRKPSRIKRMALTHACAHEVCAPAPSSAGDGAFRRVLWVALAINAAMFAVEASVGISEGSVALQADAVDFFGDATTYGISLFVLARTMRWRASAALFKGLMMAAFGVGILGLALHRSLIEGAPSAFAMGGVAILALVANLICAGLLYRHRNGESNRRSVWICSRNDALGNLAVVFAATGVFVTASPWPDIFVGVVMAGLGLTGAYYVIRQSTGELRDARLVTS